MKTQLSLLISGIIFLVACQASTQQAALLVPENSGQQERDILQRSLSSMLNRTDIRLSENAFVISSEVIIERRQNESLLGNLNLGRDYGTPDHFKLWRQGESCMLEHLETGKMLMISELTCVVAPQE